MKLNLLNSKWLDIVFEGRNKIYGAYELRKSNTKTNVRALIIGASIFSLAIATPLLISLIPESTGDDTMDQKITTVKLPPKKDKPKEDLKPPPPPPPKQTVVKFVKPVVAKTEDVKDDPPPVVNVEKTGEKDVKGSDQGTIDPGPVGDGPPSNDVVEEDTSIHNAAGLEVQPGFPGGSNAWKKFLEKKFEMPDEAGLNGRVIMSFVVEKDGSLTDIKILKDIGYGAGKAAERALRLSPKWTPAEQNGRKVRCAFQQAFTIQTPEE